MSPLLAAGDTKTRIVVIKGNYDTNKRAMMALDRSPEKNLNQMLNVAIYITKIWPSELLYYPIPSIEFVKTLITSGKWL